MKKIFSIILLIFTTHFSLQVISAQIVNKSTKEWKVLGESDRIAYFDIDKLSNSTDRNNRDIFTAFNSQRKPESFFQTFNRNLKECWNGSILKNDVVAYCFPYLTIGYYDTDLPKDFINRFIPVSQGVFVWYEKEKNKYYLWAGGLKSENVLGPFDGEPVEALKKSIRKREKNRFFSGVEFKVKSQNWKYPDMPKPPEMPPCITNYCPQFEANEKYHKITTHFELINNSKKSVYYLASNSKKEVPILHQLKRKTGTDYWNDAEILYQSGYGGFYTKWIILPPGAKTEFELDGYGYGNKSYEFALVVFLNDKPVFWDEIKLLTKVQTISRNESDE